MMLSSAALPEFRDKVRCDRCTLTNTRSAGIVPADAGKPGDVVDAVCTAFAPLHVAHWGGFSSALAEPLVEILVGLGELRHSGRSARRRRPRLAARRTWIGLDPHTLYPSFRARPITFSKTTLGLRLSITGDWPDCAVSRAR